MESIKGYRQLDSESVKLINHAKEWEERLRREVANMAANRDVDQRLMKIAWTQFELGFMAWVKAIAQPDPASLPEDDPEFAISDSGLNAIPDSIKTPLSGQS